MIHGNDLIVLHVFLYESNERATNPGVDGPAEKV